MSKKIWKKPELIVLSRGRPDEWVLRQCKLKYGGSPAWGHGNCLHKKHCSVQCQIPSTT